MIIYDESGFKEWFEKNYKKLGYSKIIKDNLGKFPDFIMLKDNKKLKVELETKSSNFLLHNHSLKDTDEVVCIENDKNLGINTITAQGLTFIPKGRITITIEKELLKWIDEKIEKKIFANRSHGFEYLIKKTMDKENET
jgi:hypothetical protein